MTNCSPSLFVVLTTYLNYIIMIAMGHLRDFYRRFVPDERSIVNKNGFAPLLRDQDDFFNRRLFRRTRDCWNRPIASRPGAYIDVCLQESKDYNKTLRMTGETRNCLNLGSYNYLGFAQNPEHATTEVFQALDQYGLMTCSTAAEYGYTALHRELEDRMAAFLHKEACLVVGMGFATNSTIIPALCGKGSLIISDSLNHTSIVVGARASGATIRVFKHNDMNGLERVIRNSIAEGQPRTHKPWKKVIILVEGIYSMEGEILDLKRVVDIKKKYKCYLYVDEAHSIGALGVTGRGVCEHCNVDFDDVDILMGTYTKSFGSVGGYICSTKAVIDHLRNNGFSPLYCPTMPTGCAQQIISALKVITGEDGSDIGRKRIQALRENSDLLRSELKRMGFEIIGDEGSPVVILMIYNPGKVSAFSRLCLEQNLAVVVVGAPATDLIEARVRFCTSAAHTKDDIMKALKVLDKVGDLTMTKYCKPWWYKLKQIAL